MALTPQSPGAPQGASTTPLTVVQQVGPDGLTDDERRDYQEAQSAIAVSKDRDSWLKILVTLMALFVAAAVVIAFYSAHTGFSYSKAFQDARMQENKECREWLQKNPHRATCPGSDTPSETRTAVAKGIEKATSNERETFFFRNNEGDGENLHKKLAELEQKATAEIWIDTGQKVANLCLRDGWMVDGEKPPDKCTDGNNAVHFSKEQAGRLLTWRKS